MNQSNHWWNFVNCDWREKIGETKLIIQFYIIIIIFWNVNVWNKSDFLKLETLNFYGAVYNTKS